MRPQPSPFHPTLRAASLLLAAASFAAISSAQTATPPLIKVESHEVVLPIRVIHETKEESWDLIAPDGGMQHGRLLYSKDVTGLSPKSVHIFDDGVEVNIQHFSVEKADGWVVRDNMGRHLNYSCVPRGIWRGQDTPSVRDAWYHTYLVTYVPPPSPTGSCHSISVTVDRKGSRVFAPTQYCNTNDPLSDPLKQTELENRLVAYADSKASGNLPLTLQAVQFRGPSNTARINLSAELPANQLTRRWDRDGTRLVTSIAILGLVFDKNRTLVTRFSDTACAPGEEGYSGPLPPATDFLERDAQNVVPSGYSTQLDIATGDCYLEILLTDGENFGRADISLSVDDFSSRALSISGVALCKRYHKPSPDERGPTRAPQYVPLMFDGQEFTPAGNTQFKKGEQLMTYVEIYGSELRAPATPKLFMEMKVFDEKTNELKIGTGVRPVDSMVRPDSQPPAIPLVWEMEVAKLPTGSYRLEAQASDSAGNKTPWRATTFSVE